MPVQMWDVNKCLFCIIVMSLTGSTAVEKEFFQSEEATFQCEHNLAVDELLQVEWKKYADSCALMDLNNGNVVRIKYPCGWEARANMTATNVTIFSLEPSDDGEFSCTALKSGYVPVNGTRFKLTVKVKAENHLLLLDGTQHSCDSPVTVDTADTSTLTCSVDSKPQANFTWSSQPGLTTSLVGSTACNQQSDKVYHCTNTLTLQNSVIPTSGVTVTCHVEAFGNTTNLCMKLVPTLVRCNSTSCKYGGTCDESTGCKCADNWNGTYCTQECQLITSVPVFYNVTLGGNHTFACNASGDVSWKRHGMETHQERTLSLVKVHQNQEGYYYCHATSSLCTQSVRFKLTVLHYWETDLESVREVKPGKFVVVNCSVTGQPVPNVQWSRLTDDNSSNPSLGNASLGWSLLELHSFQADDAGQYVCSASYLDFHTNWTISIKLVDDGSGIQTWVIVVIVFLCVVLLSVLVLFLLLKLLLNKSPEKAIGPFGSQTKLIVVGLLVVILLPGIGLALVISYYLVKVTESSNGEEPKRERTPSNATASKVHPEMTGNEEQVMSNNGTKGGAVTPALSAVSGTPLALSATVTQTHGGAPVKLEPLAPTETTDVVDVQEEKKKKKKKKKKKHRKHKDEENVYNEIEDATAETTLVSGEPEEK